MIRRNWHRTELLLALNLYCRLPYGQYHGRNPEIIQLAEFIDRTSDAVAMKLSNFVSFDPYHQLRGISGLQNASRADRDMWNEFNLRWEELAIESELAYAQLLEETDATNIVESLPEVKTTRFTGLTETERKVKVRLGQSFFRKVILASYRSKCCVCGMPIPAMLIASHIVPWSEDENLRVNPHNGLCLCALHDKGFDQGFFTLGDNYEILVGKV